MVFGLLRGKVRMRLEWPAERIYRPGETIPVQVHVRIEGRPKLRGLRVGLVFWQRYRYPDWDERNEDGTRDYYMTWKEREHWAVQARLPLPQPLPKVFQKTYSGAIAIPRDVPPPHEGRICQGRWYLKVIADRPMLPDDEHRALLRLVVPRPGVFQRPGFYGQASHPRVVDMRLELPGLEAVEGGVLEGRLHLRAHKPIEARGLHMALDVREFIRLRPEIMPGLRPTLDEWDHDSSVPDYLDDRTRAAQARLAAPFRMAASETRVFPFQLEVPRLNKPSCTACGEGGFIAWTLHGFIERPWTRDYEVTQEVYVYGDPVFQEI